MSLDARSGPPTGAPGSRAERVVSRVGPRFALLAFGGFWVAQLGGSIAVHLVGTLVYGLLGHDVTDPAVRARLAESLVPPSVVVGLGSSALVVGLIAHLGVGDRVRARGSEGLGWSAGPGRIWATAALGAVALCAASQIVAYTIIPPSEAEIGPLVQMASRSALGFGVFALVGVAIAPPVEELLFRGIMLHGFTRRWRLLPSAALVTALFAGSHVPEALYYPPGLIGVAALAVYTVWLRIRTGRLGPAIAAHAAYNALLVALLGLALAGVGPLALPP